MWAGSLQLIYFYLIFDTLRPREDLDKFGDGRKVSQI
jgi:hypothetical protein